MARASPGDIVTVDLNLTPENGYVPHSLFDTSGQVSFVLGWRGHYLPGLHTLIESLVVDEQVRGVSIDAGWGARRDQLIVKVRKKKLRNISNIDLIKVGSRLHLQGDIEVSVIDVTDDNIVVDANPPLAGASYSCDVKLLSIEPIPPATVSSTSTSRYQIASFALGCFWGAELAFMRMPGVVGTKVGYTQGVTTNPTYEQVCTGETRHREAVLVVYDSEQVSYQSLMQVALERLHTTTSHFKTYLLEEEDESAQYKHGFYYHSDEQRRLAEAQVEMDNRYRIDVSAAATFYDAEDYHQQYLLKGGQSARKGAREPIRCFG